MESSFLQSVRMLLDKYKGMAEKTFEQLSDEQLHWQYNEESNSIAILINHLWGNMMSRWTDFRTSDGEKEWRRRDAEFASSNETRGQLMLKWAEGWEKLLSSIEELNPGDLEKKVSIRGQENTVTEAIHMSMVHYVSHIGQIMYIGKMLKGDEWISLSIPRKNRS